MVEFPSDDGALDFVSDQCTLRKLSMNASRVSTEHYELPVVIHRRPLSPILICGPLPLIPYPLPLSNGVRGYGYRFQV